MRSTPQDLDVALLDRLRAGDDKASGKLLAAYEPYLTVLARVQIGSRLQGKVDAADVVQEVFLEVQRQRELFRGTSLPEFSAWLRRILAGQIALLIRRYIGTQGRDVHLERELGVQIDQSSAILDGGLVADITTPSQQASRHEQSVLLADALNRLPDDYREVILLRHLEALRFPEVARRMGRTEDSVQKLWVRALARLRQSMAIGEGDEP